MMKNVHWGQTLVQMLKPDCRSWEPAHSRSSHVQCYCRVWRWYLARPFPLKLQLMLPPFIIIIPLFSIPLKRYHISQLLLLLLSVCLSVANFPIPLFYIISKGKPKIFVQRPQWSSYYSASAILKKVSKELLKRKEHFSYCWGGTETIQYPQHVAPQNV
jgi:hypothetical protein